MGFGVTRELFLKIIDMDRVRRKMVILFGLVNIILTGNRIYSTNIICRIPSCNSLILTMGTLNMMRHLHKQ
jgi:hypothetical protein